MCPIVSAIKPPYRPVKLGRDDIPGILALERECFAVPWSATQYHLAFGHKTFAAYGVKADGDLAAYVAYAELSLEMEIFNLGVRAAYRRLGMAKACSDTFWRVVPSSASPKAFWRCAPPTRRP